MASIVKMVFGSHLYGLNHVGSDMDYKGVLLPTASQILRQDADFHVSKSTGMDHAKNGAEDIDEEYFSLMRFIRLAMKGETAAIDMLHAPADKIIKSSYVWDELVDNRSKFYTKNMKAYVGYVRKQAAKYSVKGSRMAVVETALNLAKSIDDGINVRRLGSYLASLPVNEHAKIITVEHPTIGEQTFYEIVGRKYQSTLSISMFIIQLQKIYNEYGARAKAAKDNKNIDWKAISHALRAGYQAKHIYQAGGFTYPLPETDFLMKVKMGELDFLTEVQPVLDELVSEVEILAEESSYPDIVNHEFWLRIIEKLHGNIVGAERTSIGNVDHCLVTFNMI